MRKALVTTTVAIGLASAVFGAAPAYAEGDIPGQVAHGCVARDVRDQWVGSDLGWIQVAKLTNNCGRLYKAQVIVDFGPDSQCYHLNANQVVEFNIPLGSYRKTVAC